MRCVCGHPFAGHFRETGPCMASTPDVVWACLCGRATKPTLWARFRYRLGWVPTP